MKLNSNNFKKVYKELGVELDKLGCVMLDVEPNKQMMISEDAKNGLSLYTSKNQNRKWINGWVADKTPHVTLLYGLIENANKIKSQVDSVLDGWEIDSVEIENVSFFESPYEDEPYYCIIAHVKKIEKLVEGHNRLQFLPHINTFPEYTPHITICYIEKNAKKMKEVVAILNKGLSGIKIKVKKELNYGYKG